MKKTAAVYLLPMMLVFSGASMSTASIARGGEQEPIEDPIEPLKAERVDQLFSEWDKPDSPGCALGVVRDGGFIYRRGYGMANLDHGIPMSSRTSFYICSTSKQFTAMSIALLLRDGVIALDDDIRRHLPELPEYDRPITIGDLVHHTSGLRDYLGLIHLSGRYFDNTTDGDFLKDIARQNRLNFLPGDAYSYSNTNYFLMSEIVEKVSGKSLRDFADERIFQPLGMNDTFFHDERGEIIKKRASGYSPAEETFSVILTNFAGVGDGGLYTSVDDLLLWDRNFYNNKLGGGAELIDQVLTTRPLNNGDPNNYAFGLVPGDYRGLRRVGHSGSFMGFRTEMLRFPEQRFSVIALCNLSSIDAASLALRVADIYLEEQFNEAVSGEVGGAASEHAIRRPSDRELTEITGDYFNPETGLFRSIAIKDGKVLYIRTDGSSGELTPIGDLRFSMVDSSPHIEIQFSRSKPGELMNMEVAIANSRSQVFARYQSATYTPEDLEHFAGTYYSEDLEAEYVITVEGSRLKARVGSETFFLEAAFADAFANKDGFLMRFNRDGGAPVSGFSLDVQTEKGFLFRRI